MDNGAIPGTSKNNQFRSTFRDNAVITTSNQISHFSLQRVEDNLREDNVGHSKLKTLVESYKIHPIAHETWMKSEIENSRQIQNCEHKEKREKLLAVKNDIDNTDDIIVICELYEQFRSIISEIRDYKYPELSLKAQYDNLMKRNEYVTSLINKQTEELCVRIMYAAEEQRALKKNMTEKLDHMLLLARDEMTTLIVRRFQDLRVRKLRELASNISDEHLHLHDEKLTELRKVAMKLHEATDRTACLEMELDTQLRNMRHRPAEHNCDLMNQANQLKELQIEVRNLDDLAKKITENKKSFEMEAIDKIEELNKEHTKLSIQNAHLDAQLCKLMKRALSHNLHLDDKFQKRITLYNWCAIDH